MNTFAKELKGYRTSKGTIRFPSDKPLPDALIKKIVKERVKENAEWDWVCRGFSARWYTGRVRREPWYWRRTAVSSLREE
jgi:hypothetical protein